MYTIPKTNIAPARKLSLTQRESRLPTINFHRLYEVNSIYFSQVQDELDKEALA